MRNLFDRACDVLGEIAKRELPEKCVFIKVLQTIAKLLDTATELKSGVHSRTLGLMFSSLVNAKSTRKSELASEIVSIIDGMKNESEKNQIADLTGIYSLFQTPE